MKPSTDAARVTRVASVAIAALLAASCARSGSVVEAAMIPTDVAALSAKPDGGRSPPPPKPPGELPWKSGQRLRGTYTCGQGKTTLTVEIQDVSGDDFDATAEFDFPGAPRLSLSPSPSPLSSPARGSWRMRGSFDAKRKSVRLEADSWIEEAEGYELTDFAGTVDANGGISGHVEGPGCSSFSLTIEKVDKTDGRR